VKKLHHISYSPQLSFEGASAFIPRPVDVSNVTLSRDMQVKYIISLYTQKESTNALDKSFDLQSIIQPCMMIIIVLLQSMAELLAENYHNIWARKKKMELEAKGDTCTPPQTELPITDIYHIFYFVCLYCHYIMAKKPECFCLSFMYNCLHS